LAEKLEQSGFNKESTILLMCRSGTRSSKAASLLNKLGYSKAYTVVDGYEGDKVKEGEYKDQRLVNGWKNANLPWTYKLPEEKVYVE
jgi:rhodanese-related sulfurtransferase